MKGFDTKTFLYSGALSIPGKVRRHSARAKCTPVLRALIRSFPASESPRSMIPRSKSASLPPMEPSIPSSRSRYSSFDAETIRGFGIVALYRAPEQRGKLTPVGHPTVS